MTADRRAAVAALTPYVERWRDAPALDGGGVVVNVGEAVDAVFRAGCPTALVPPRYDYTTGPETWHPITRPEAGPLVEHCFLPGREGLCEVWQRTDRGAPALVGHISVSALHQLGLTACSVAAEAAREQESEGV